MTTEEFEKKLKISEKTCIHCPTLELAKQVLNIFHQLGLRWRNETHYITYTNWDKYKENTIYFPFNRDFSSLGFAYITSFKILNAEEFILLHTEFDLENYIPKGELKDFPKEIIARMLECQEEQCNPRDISVFERNKTAGELTKGFVWGKTKEGYDFWNTVIRYKNFAHFFEWYPKQNNQDNSQDFKVGDKVIDIITRQIGFVKNINLKEVTMWKLEVVFEDCTTKFYSLEGKYYDDSKIPILLHYQDDYDYDVIDFNNLPKRQEAKRWRAIKGGVYYSFTSNFGVEESTEDNYYLDNKAYESGNYFQTKEEAQEVADKLNKYFQELIQTKK